MEQKYYYGNAISEYGLQNGRVDYATLAKCFDAVLNNDIMSLTYNIGYWEQVSGTVDNTYDIEELEEKKEELEDKQEEIENLLEDANDQEENKLIEQCKDLGYEIEKIKEEIEDLESEQDQEQEVFQWFIVDDWGLDYYSKLMKLFTIMKRLICIFGALLITELVGIMFLLILKLIDEVLAMTIFNVRYTPNGINVYNYDYNYDHMFIFYTKREIEKIVRETLGLKYKKGVVFKW